jgi:N-acetylmuramoyl-L-alanine amidase
MSLTNKESQSERFAEALRTEVGRVRALWRDQAMRANFAVLTDATCRPCCLKWAF